MMMKKRIIALTNYQSTTWNIVNNKLGDCFIHSDIESIKQSLVKSWSEWKINNFKYFKNNKLDMNYSAEVNAKKISDLFQKVLNEK